MRRYYSIDFLRPFLTFFVCAISFGYPDATGSLQAVSGFATLTFFIIEGFLVLRPGEEFEARLKRAILRTGGLFLAMLVVYGGLNALMFGPVMGQILRMKRLWFNFIVMNQWPFVYGECIWFIQCLLYGYIAVFILHKLKLLRFYRPIMAVCLVITLVTGEFSGFFHFNILGYDRITATVITRSLPYLLLGRLLYDNRRKIDSLHVGVPVSVAVLGMLMTFLEYFLLVKYDRLNYAGHFVGNALIAVGLLMLCIKYPYVGQNSKRPHTRRIAKINYVLHQPLGYFMSEVISGQLPVIYDEFWYYIGGAMLVSTFAISWFVAWVIEGISKRFKRTEQKKEIPS